MAYLLDTNVFIEAKNRYYGFDFCPAFWEWIDRANAAGHVFSIDKVAGELRGGDDELADWAHERTRGFFLEGDPALLPSLRALSTWPVSPATGPPRLQPSSKMPTTTWWPTSMHIAMS